MALLITCVLLPLLDLGIIPVRFGLTASIVHNFARKLSLVDKPSQAYDLVASDPSLAKALLKLGGVQPGEPRLEIVIASHSNPDDKIIVDRPRRIPATWLPEGAVCPCHYMLSLSQPVEISPLVIVPIPGPGIPGLSAPLTTTFRELVPWENLGRNPKTGEFYVNE